MIQIKPGQVLILNQQQCLSLITEEEVVKLVEQVLADYSNGLAINPLKGHMPFFPDHYGWINSMPSWLKKENIAGIKWAGLGEENPEKHGIPQCSAAMILNDTDTAYPIAFMDATGIMALRTGAAAAIMGKYCAKKSSRVMTMVGAGVQNTSALHMFMITMPGLKEIRIVDINPAATERFIQNSQKKFPSVTFVRCDDLQKAATGSDIIVTAIHAKGNKGEGILDNILLDKGTTLVEIAGGISLHKIREKTDRVITDFIDCVIHRLNQAGKYMEELFGQKYYPADRSQFDGEIGDIITGKTVGRKNDDEIINVSGIGMSIEDLVVANTIFLRAKEKDIGMVVDLIN